MIETSTDAAIAEGTTGPTLSVRSVISSTTPKGPVTSSVRSSIAVNRFLSPFVGALIRGSVSDDLTSIDCVVADIAGWVKLPKPEADGWLTLHKPED